MTDELRDTIMTRVGEAGGIAEAGGNTFADREVLCITLRRTIVEMLDSLHTRLAPVVASDHEAARRLDDALGAMERRLQDQISKMFPSVN